MQVWITQSQIIKNFIVAATVFTATQGCAQTAPKSHTNQTADHTPQRVLVVSLEDRKLALVEDGEVARIYTVAVGKPSTPSPEGSFTIERRVANPTYQHNGKTIAPGPNNPVGTRWMGLSKGGYGIHGTNEPRSIGKAASHGCIRMGKGLEGLLLKEQEDNQMGVTTDIQEKQVRIAELQAEAEAVQKVKESEGEAKARVAEAKGEADAMQYTLPLKQKQIEQSKLEAEARKEATIQNAQAEAEAKVIDSKAELERRNLMADAEANRSRRSSDAQAVGNSAWSANCSASDDPWPILPQPALPTQETRAFLNAARNYFSGAVNPNYGVELASFYTAIPLPQPGPVNPSEPQPLLVSTINGKVLEVTTSAIRPINGARDWGSDLALLKTACGSGTQIIASASGEALNDSLRAYELHGLEAVPASTPLQFDGAITALSPSSDGASLLAIVHNNNGDYEVDHVTAVCP